jgi:hypothetical protein
MNEMFSLFYDVFYSLIFKNKLQLSKQYKPSNEVNRLIDLKELDALIMELFNINKDILGEGYDIISYSSTFLRFLSKKNVESVTKEILELHDTNSLYGWTNRVRIDPPNDERRTYGWHQEVFYTIPETRFLQTWCPVIRDTTVDNGTIELCLKSNSEGIAKQSWTDIEGRATQIIVAPEIVNKYEQIQLEMKIGDVLFFDGRLFHKSGHNSTKDEIRFSLVGMWNDVNHEGFRGPKPSFNQRTEDNRREYWERLNKENNWGY